MPGRCWKTSRISRTRIRIRIRIRTRTIRMIRTRIRTIMIRMTRIRIRTIRTRTGIRTGIRIRMTSLSRDNSLR